MNKDIFEGWKDIRDVQIPPLSQKGFGEDVIIREKVEPIRPEKDSVSNRTPKVKDVQPDDEATVLIQRTKRKEAFIIREKNNEYIKISGDSFMIGKADDNDYVVADNASVSRKHCVITYEDGQYFIEDLHSSNHVYVDDVGIKEKTLLKDKTKFELSDEVFQMVIR